MFAAVRFDGSFQTQVAKWDKANLRFTATQAHRKEKGLIFFTQSNRTRTTCTSVNYSRNTLNDARDFLDVKWNQKSPSHYGKLFYHQHGNTTTTNNNNKDTTLQIFGKPFVTLQGTVVFNTMYSLKRTKRWCSCSALHSFNNQSDERLTCRRI